MQSWYRCRSAKKCAIAVLPKRSRVPAFERFLEMCVTASLGTKTHARAFLSGAAVSLFVERARPANKVASTLARSLARSFARVARVREPHVQFRNRLPRPACAPGGSRSPAAGCLKYARNKRSVWQCGEIVHPASHTVLRSHRRGPKRVGCVCSARSCASRQHLYANYDRIRIGLQNAWRFDLPRCSNHRRWSVTVGHTTGH